MMIYTRGISFTYVHAFVLEVVTGSSTCQLQLFNLS